MRLTPDALVYNVLSAGDPKISPDGRQVVYTVGRADRQRDQGTSQLWLANLDGSNARQLTFGGDRNREARWSPDGQQVAFVSDRVKNRSSLLDLPVRAPGEARQITQHLRAIGHLAWSPDGARIAYTTSFDPDNPDEQPLPEGRPPRPRVTRRLDYKQDNRGYLNDVRGQVFVVDVTSGTRRMRAFGSFGERYVKLSM